MRYQAQLRVGFVLKSASFLSKAKRCACMALGKMRLYLSIETLVQKNNNGHALGGLDRAKCYVGN